MRKIDKRAEPREWKEYRQTPGARYQPTKELIEALLEEQGYICAYCERRIPHQDAPLQEDHRIDHLRPQEQSKIAGDDADLDYGNMVICCPGNIANSGKEHYHCDKAKGSKPLKISPLSAAMMNTIRFTPTGTIKSTDAELDKELGEEGLNLNDVFLKENRLTAWETVVEQLNDAKWTKKHVMTVLEYWQQRHTFTYNDGTEHQGFEPYCSMVCFMLRKILNAGTVK